MEADRLALRRDLTHPQRDALLIPLFAGTLFTSAALLFWIQPLFAKMTMPLLGGTPAVWTTAMVFFQATLLAAYGYAHWLTRALALRSQFLVHAAVLALASLSLPIAVRWPFDPAGQPIVQFLCVLGVSIGLPFFAVAATAPLLQRWFSRTGHESSADPYYLYGASNLGSVLALIGFPFVMEPLLRLAQQSALWTMGYATLSVLILCCGYTAVTRAGNEEPPLALPARAGTAAGNWRERARWVLLAAVPSSLMLGVTTHISTDLAPIPLLWVVPLALYLLTFVVAFSSRGPWVLAVADTIAPYLIIPALMLGVIWAQVVGFSIAVNLALFFLLALICHGALAKSRPPVARLTEFYFLLSLGGVLGGLFNAVVAPLVFDGVYEYPLAIVLAVCLRPSDHLGDDRRPFKDMFYPAALFVTVYPIVAWRWYETLGSYGMAAFWTMIAVTGLLVFSAKDRPLRFGLATGVLIAVLLSASSARQGETLARERSFFSVYRVAEVEEGGYRTLASGTTLHGVQSTLPGETRTPWSYYSKDGPVGQLFGGLRQRPLEQIGIIGLGAGASLCYAEPGQRWAVFEIDPVVVSIAQNPRYFTYWSQCFDARRSHLRVGDARLTIRDEPDRSFDLLMVDAYNSDAVPVHLLTREALALYVSKMRPHGVIALHISNRHLDLARVVAALAADAGLKGWIQHYTPGADAHRKDQVSIWAVLAMPGHTVPFLDGDPRWKPLSSVKAPVLWTDDYSNVVSILR